MIPATVRSKPKFPAETRLAARPLSDLTFKHCRSVANLWGRGNNRHDSDWLCNLNTLVFGIPHLHDHRFTVHSSLTLRLGSGACHAKLLILDRRGRVKERKLRKRASHPDCPRAIDRGKKQNKPSTNKTMTASPTVHQVPEK